ncbi:hypothetical protein GCM10023321_23200 [Pseudonocardia eucalypti]|uniref:DNA recombination-mediator protein A n=1 Tax=Pseudonocardia eucalypti TaxID=648755 RepID=A0ABP9Q168_9PSEU|nr:hypothetical protein [Pseudonocardia eucalypti]
MTWTEADSAVEHGITITGSRSTEHRSAEFYGRIFEAYLEPFAQQNAHFHIGGALGIDTLTLNWLANNTPSAITIAVPCSVNDQPHEAADAIRSWARAGRLADIVELNAPALGTPAYHVRNRWMVDRTQFVIGFPRNDDPGSGTWYTLGYAAEQRKPRMIVPI